MRISLTVRDYKNTNILSTFLLSLLCMYVNNPFYIASIETINKLLFYALALFPIIRWIINKRIVIEKEVLSYFAYLIFYLFVAISVIFVTRSFDTDYINYYLRQLLGIFGIYSVYTFWKRDADRGTNSAKFYEIYLNSLILYWIGTILFLAFPGLKNGWLSIISSYESAVFLTRTEYVTRVSFAGFAGYTVAFQISSGLVIYAYMLVNNELYGRKKHIYLIALFIGCLFYGRVGLIAGVVIFSVLVIYMEIIKHSIKLLVTISLIIAIATFVLSRIYLYGEGPAKNFVDWAFEPLINYFTKDTLSSLSSDSLRRAYQNFHPSLDVLLRGEGHWVNANGSYYAGADVGFMRNIYYGGLFYTIIVYSTAAVLIGKICQKMKQTGRSGAVLIAILLIIHFVIFELKGDITFSFIKAYMVLFLTMTYEKVYPYYDCEPSFQEETN